MQTFIEIRTHNFLRYYKSSAEYNEVEERIYLNKITKLRHCNKPQSIKPMFI